MSTICEYDDRGRLVSEQGDGWFWRFSPNGEINIKLGERPTNLSLPPMFRDPSGDGWLDIASAPKDGTPIEVCQIREGGEIAFRCVASWRTVTFPSFINGRYGVEPEHTDTYWMLVDQEKYAPGPTHWRPHA